MVGEKKKRRAKGKLINAAAHANFLLRANNTAVVQQGVLASMAELDCFCKINNLENRFLRFGAHMSTWAEDIHPLKTMSPSRLTAKKTTINTVCAVIVCCLFYASLLEPSL